MPQTKFESGDPDWILRRDAADLCSVSERTVQRWLEWPKSRRPRTRIVQRGRQRLLLLNRADVERIHAARIKADGAVKSEIVDALIRGDPPAVILREHHLSLGEFEKLRDQFARVTGGSVLQGPHVRQICDLLGTAQFDAPLLLTALRALVQIRNLLDIGQADYPTLVAAIQALLERHSRLVAERPRARDVRAIVKPLEPDDKVDRIDEPPAESPPPSSSKRGSSGSR